MKKQILLARCDFEVPVLGTSGWSNGSELYVEIDNIDIRNRLL